jgi:hypothetical protein
MHRNPQKAITIWGTKNAHKASVDIGKKKMVFEDDGVLIANVYPA